MFILDKFASLQIDTEVEDGKHPQHIHLNPSFSFAIHRYFLHRIILTW